MSDLSEKVRTVLINEGVGNEGGIHGWRCFDKERYPEPCDCMDEIVSQIENLVEVEVRAAEQRVLHDALEQGYANGKSHGLLDGYNNGFTDGVKAAREAVAALDPDFAHGARGSHRSFTVIEMHAAIDKVVKA